VAPHLLLGLDTVRRDPAAVMPTLDEQRRAVIRVTADRAFFNPSTSEGR